MANVTPPYADRGVASFEVLDTYLQNNLLAGNHPELKPAFSYPMANSTTFAQFSVVGLNAAGNIALAVMGSVDPDDDIKPIGVLPHAVALGATGTMNAPVWYSGCFDMDALVWDDSYDTEAKKLAAFQGSPTPTTILVAKRGA